MSSSTLATRRVSGAPRPGLPRAGTFPLRVWWGIGGLLLALLLGGLALLMYRSLDRLYPQELGKYFRPPAASGPGSVLYRDGDGQLFLAPVADTSQAKHLLDPSVPAGVREIVRDALVLPDGQQVAYFATERVTERKEGQLESDHLKVLTLGSGLVHGIAMSDAVGEPLRPALYVSESGRYVAVTSRDRARAYYYDVSGGRLLTAAAADPSPERMLWNRNGDGRIALLPGQPAFALAPDGKQRALLREGKRKAPECDAPKCEAVQELVISSGALPGSLRGSSVIYGAFSSFSAEGWGPIPAQSAQRFYGRLVWSPDGTQLLFSTLDGADVQTFAIGSDGKTQPRLVLAGAEALDWIP